MLWLKNEGAVSIPTLSKKNTPLKLTHSPTHAHDFLRSNGQFVLFTHCNCAHSPQTSHVSHFFKKKNPLCFNVVREKTYLWYHQRFCLCCLIISLIFTHKAFCQLACSPYTEACIHIHSYLGFCLLHWACPTVQFADVCRLYLKTTGFGSRN